MHKERLVFTNSKGQRLVGILTRPDEICPIAIFCHGFRSTKESSKAKALAQSLPKKGIGLFAFDFSGRGESEGKFEDTTLTQYIDDLKCCINLLKAYTPVIAVIGSSLGGLVALQQARGDRRIKAVVLISPVSTFPYQKKDIYADIPGWKRKGYSYTYSEKFGKMRLKYGFYTDSLQYDGYGQYKSIKAPALIIHGTKDESVQLADSKKLKKHIAKSTLAIMKDADHKYTEKQHFDKLINTTTQFLAKTLLKV